MTAILETRGLDKHFGGLHVTNGVDFSLSDGEIHCLIGPNGAGKSTFFRLLIGEYTPERGQVLYRGEDITALKPFERVRRGLSVKFQVPGIFPGLTVSHNLEIALQHHLEGSSLGAEIRRLLAFLNLADSAGERAGTLSHGQKQWLEIGMAISLKPRLLLLDEPTAGMSPAETFATGEMVQALNRDGVAILAIEHDMAFVRQIAQRVTVLHVGRIFAQGTTDEIVANEAVAAIYLGETEAPRRTEDA
ncbi:ABC transporter ATP-binding protein [Methylobacterium frigidaeris]|uniref:Lipopolysaccharide export system ATP-binding protein LptB n=1 Tax=Methylobacterium frigidaeris TaxID=2038277 RepID=A0AA37M664_9HYPH|nr:ABC transporter ATP-binding protein [Methylobacterium frigidaeris]PIK72958.1 ABC transporter ATP-binding protein [Methylobacterium frigidaeris]GJD64328.1 Lipopolysaccharide export system ATP-binding protein LptB [Methylobacterium frigidaeris]